MTWKLLPPIKGWRRAAKLRAARDELRSLGIDPHLIDRLLTAADFQRQEPIRPAAFPVLPADNHPHEPAA
jgi:hypothetical protein